MDVKLPPLGEGADSGTVVSIAVKVGDRVEKGQNILELENEKAVAGIPSTASGVVANIFVKEGDKISVGQRLVSLTEAEGKTPAPDQAGKARPSGEASRPETDRSRPKESPDEAAEKRPDASEPILEPVQTTSGLPPAASPSIRKLARDLGIDLRRVRGSERGGRIVLGDLRAYIQRLEKLAFTTVKAESKPATKAVAPSIDFAQWGAVTRKPFSTLRRTISRRMVEAWTTIPHVTQFDEADITDLLALRKRHVAAFEAAGAHLTLTSFALKALVNTLQKHPIFNSSLDEGAEELVFKEYYHIGIAVDTEAGLIVPVLRDVDKKNLLDLSKELKDLAERTRDRKVHLDEMKGGTFTISNQGGIGGGHFTPLINKPEVAILGLGQGKLKAAVRDKQITPRTILPLALSYDHRVIDGGAAARFIHDLVQAVENFGEDSVKL